MIHGENISYSYGRQVVVDGVTITVPEQGTLGLVGPNGSGKTTLLRTLYGSLQPSAGAVTVNDQPFRQLSRKKLSRTLAVVAQEHASDLPMIVADLVMLGRMPHQGLASRPSAVDEQTVADALARVGVLHLAGRNFSDLSGGERQRVLIARALAQEATHILLDEPTNHLDIRFQHDVLDLLACLPTSCAVVLHDLNLAARYCDHVLVLESGRVVAQGAPTDVLIPEILEPVYGIQVHRIDVDGEMNLLFRKKSALRPSVSVPAA
ncbi:ABC transporter ATP-binding protein [Corynebacterium comes]|uniref:Iron(3+)-hydroxamate import ATP-binding protein FhuC n=1 Tax=Corynebacterium comes TaxID=2675218 RepID=A0A6B8WG49_9CORY|nr:ABC transporter ATP-binding protein [Corynebacterium comes]QGU05628.1 Iron(3+)-hydroxamate import ATP-binding protein FhuC [Corynebacterium comes]